MSKKGSEQSLAKSVSIAVISVGDPEKCLCFLDMGYVLRTDVIYHIWQYSTPIASINPPVSSHSCTTPTFVQDRAGWERRLSRGQPWSISQIAHCAALSISPWFHWEVMIIKTCKSPVPGSLRVHCVEKRMRHCLTLKTVRSAEQAWSHLVSVFVLCAQCRISEQKWKRFRFSGRARL